MAALQEVAGLSSSREGEEASGEAGVAVASVGAQGRGRQGSSGRLIGALIPARKNGF